MRARKNELDVDFIGGAGPLTKEEEKRISDYIKSRKAKGKVASQRTPKKLTTRKRVTA
jgi:predicted polyphosphate/ATP-dependent NAD kinase